MYRQLFVLSSEYTREDKIRQKKIKKKRKEETYIIMTVL